ncbi:hypothetical protein [Chryseobacterium caseinilyticum]|uniref:Outer membrane protein beta-barrel domain-containing protein n=1 Tax=Chryseobacterium caseinilyticum TaxID=2771428 RepID=A0ABR8Z957_9FLAO|nr:hypothetical protein [Chryseobacterium caseinilyticum]MBD8081802.1 hypothetical protein [Chryseobacterium caseinilyticum]
MKTKITLIATVCLSAFAFSQNQNVHTQMHYYTKKVDSIILAEKSNMNIELDKVNENLKGNKVAVTEERLKRRKEIAQKYEQIINDKIENEKSELESATQELVRNAVLNPDGKYRLSFEPFSGKIQFSGKRVLLPKDYLHSVKLSVSFVGVNLTTKKEPFRFYSKDSDVKNTVYNSINFSVRYENQLGGFRSPVFYRVGIGSRTDYFTPKYGKVFAQDDKNLFVQDFSRGTVKRTSLNNSYILVPLELKWVLNPKYVEHENVKYVDNRQTQFYVLAGLYGGVKATSVIYNKFSTEYSKRIVERETVANGVNNFLVGGKFGIGYGGVGLYIQKDFTPTFNNDALLTSKYGLQIGLELLSVNF